jgi:AcrR family transcriptional regulator
MNIIHYYRFCEFYSLTEYIMPRTADPNMRTNLLQAARGIFAEKGYEKTRMQDIAERAGVAVGTIYLYFKTKDAMAIALADELNARLLAESISQLEQPDLEKAIGDAVHAALSLLAAERDLIRMLYLNVGLGALSDVAHGEHDIALRQGLAAHLRQRIETGQMRSFDAEALAVLIIGMVDWAAQAALFYEMGDLATYEQTVVALLWGGIKHQI